ncbi:hypothetical protein GCM10008022_26860 [Paenibacillus hunanensis]|nr:hypothetical protein GCM10008022_26860 [Paenibacillus hunanensis]
MKTALEEEIKKSLSAKMLLLYLSSICILAPQAQVGHITTSQKPLSPENGFGNDKAITAQLFQNNLLLNTHQKTSEFASHPSFESMPA